MESDRPAPAKPVSPRAKSSTPGNLRTPPAYKLCDQISEGLIYLSVVFAPWAFGTTSEPETWILDAMCLLLGGALATKWLIRWRTGYRPSRWSDPEPGRRGRIAAWTTRFLGMFTVAILFYCVLSALNARATIDPGRGSFRYNPKYIPWLPHSYDYPNTWVYTLHYLSFACLFWSVRDWLLGKTSRERRFFLADPPGAVSAEVRQSLKANSEGDSRVPGEMPDRFRRLLWVLCINGSLLALESILQRLSGTPKLLWLRLPVWNTDESGQFGPYAYRSNAAQYFNLIWPLCLGFWSILRKESRLRVGPGHRVGGSAHVILLPCSILLMAAPIISTSRGGALVALGGISLAICVLLLANMRSGRAIRVGIMAWFLMVIGFSGYLGWDRLQLRLTQMVEDDSMSGRKEIYENSREILKEHQTYGVGPGAFATVYKFYRKPGQVWHAWVHDDWLELRLTFGMVGFSLILGAFLLVCSRWFASAGILVPWEFTALCYVGILGCLAHAKYDFPLQVHSIAHCLLLCCSILCVTRKHGRA